MSLCKSGQIQNCCHPNALMTLKEYLMDYASPETKAIGDKLIEKEVVKCSKRKSSCDRSGKSETDRRRQPQRFPFLGIFILLQELYTGKDRVVFHPYLYDEERRNPYEFKYYPFCRPYHISASSEDATPENPASSTPLPVRILPLFPM